VILSREIITSDDLLSLHVIISVDGFLFSVRSLQEVHNAVVMFLHPSARSVPETI
jgi:hypothetical protein